MAQVQLDGVSKIFSPDLRAVDDLNLDVRDGELLVLVGPSGCGKSTSLRLIAGLERPTSGEIRIAGERVNDAPPATRNVAMVFQHDSLLPHLSVRKNLAFGLTLARGGWLRRMFVGSGKGKALSHHDISTLVREVFSSGCVKQMTIGRVDAELNAVAGAQVRAAVNFRC